MELNVIEQDGMRVLTTSQLAKSFGIDSKILLRNFQRNINHYVEGKHYFPLNGEALKKFKASRQNDVSLKFASSLYLWTETGAWMLAKSLKNNMAWKAYELLVDSYYKLTSQLKSPQELIELQNLKIAELEEKLEKRVFAIEHKMQEQITLNSGEQRRLQKAVGERAFSLETNAVKRGQIFRAIYSSIKKQFNVTSYRDVKKHELQKAIKFVEKWKG